MSLQNPSFDPLRLVTRDELLDLLRISSSTLYRMRHFDDFPKNVAGYGRRVLWQRSEIDKWQNRQNETAVQ